MVSKNSPLFTPFVVPIVVLFSYVTQMFDFCSGRSKFKRLHCVNIILLLVKSLIKNLLQNE